MKKILPGLLLLSACSTYNPVLPETEIPQTWKQSYQNDESFVLKNRFWEVFNDPILNALEDEAIEANFDLQIAACRIREARALVSKEHGRRLPEVILDGSATVDEALISPRAFGSPHKAERVRQPQYNLLADFAYEIDIWGKLKARETSAFYRQEAASWEYEFIYQTIVTDVAVHYFRLRTLEEEIRFLTQSIELRQDTVALHECRVKAGFDPELDLSRAKLNLALVEVDIEQAKREHALQQNALATLLGKPASNWSLPAGSHPIQQPPLPKIIPSDLLMRRADIQQQWFLVAAGRSDVEIAMKEYFPSFPLTGALGLSSPFLSSLFEWQARYWQIAFNALAPLYDGGRRKADIELAKARFHSTFASYQQTVNQAFQDVEDALSTLHYARLQYEAQLRALDASRDTSYLAKDRYDTGMISYLLVADLENTSLDVARRSIALRGEQILAWIRLMRALGIQKE